MLDAELLLQGLFSRLCWDDGIVSLKSAINIKTFADIALEHLHIAGVGKAPEAFPCYRQAAWQALPWQARPQQARQGELTMQGSTVNMQPAAQPA